MVSEIFVISLSMSMEYRKPWVNIFPSIAFFPSSLCTNDKIFSLHSLNPSPEAQSPATEYVYESFSFFAVKSVCCVSALKGLTELSSIFDAFNAATRESYAFFNTSSPRISSSSVAPSLPPVKSRITKYLFFASENSIYFESFVKDGNIFITEATTLNHLARSRKSPNQFLTSHLQSFSAEA